MRGWKRAVQLTGLLAAAALLAGTGRAQDDGGGGQKKKRERVKPEKVSGTVASVNAEKGKLVVSVDGEEQTVTVNKKSLITFRGVILDGVKKGDDIEMEVADMKGTKTIRKATVTREVEAPKKGKGGRGGKRKRKKGGDEGAGEDGEPRLP